MSLTVDASVVTKWFVPEPFSEEARLVLDHSVDLHAPDLLLAEIANTIWKRRDGARYWMVGRTWMRLSAWAKS